MSYCFYNWENSTIAPTSADFPSIHSLSDLYDALSLLWSVETCAPRLRSEWSPDNYTKGQCSITAFLVQDLFGGKVFGIPLANGRFHCYNVIDGLCFDLTSEQFGERAANLCYENNPEQSRDVHFSAEEKRLRYEKLRRLLCVYCQGRQ